MEKGSVAFSATFNQTLSWNEEGTLLTITPSGQGYNTNYSITLSPGAKGTDGSFLTTPRVVNYGTLAKPVPPKKVLSAKEKFLADLKAKFPNGFPKFIPPPMPRWVYCNGQMVREGECY